MARKLDEEIAITCFQHVLNYQLLKTWNSDEVCIIYLSLGWGQQLMTEVRDSLDFVNTNLFQKHGVFLRTLPRCLKRASSLLDFQVLPHFCRERTHDKKASFKLRSFCERKEFCTLQNCCTDGVLSTHTAWGRPSSHLTNHSSSIIRQSRKLKTLWITNRRFFYKGISFFVRDWHRTSRIHEINPPIVTVIVIDFKWQRSVAWLQSISSSSLTACPLVTHCHATDFSTRRFLALSGPWCL